MDTRTQFQLSEAFVCCVTRAGAHPAGNQKIHKADWLYILERVPL